MKVKIKGSYDKETMNDMFDKIARLFNSNDKYAIKNATFYFNLYNEDNEIVEFYKDGELIDGFTIDNRKKDKIEFKK